MKIQYWLNEVFIIGYNYHKKGIKDLNYALEFVVEGLICWEKRDGVENARFHYSNWPIKKANIS